MENKITLTDNQTELIESTVLIVVGLYSLTVVLAKMTRNLSLTIFNLGKSLRTKLDNYTTNESFNKTIENIKTEVKKKVQYFNDTFKKIYDYVAYSPSVNLNNYSETEMTYSEEQTLPLHETVEETNT